MKLGSSTSVHAYGEPAYWDNRYLQDTGAFDWYQKYQTLTPLLDLYLRRSDRILLVGCGNSAFGEGMVGDGYQDVVNVDISSVVIEAMQKKYQDKPTLKYIKMDVCDMSDFETSSFDAVVDKGTLDSLMCGHNAQQNVTKMLEEVGSLISLVAAFDQPIRVLKDKGVYILITYGDPRYRLRILKDLCLWTITMHVIDRMERNSEQRTWELTRPLPMNDNGGLDTTVLGHNPEVYYIYVCTKDSQNVPDSFFGTIPEPCDKSTSPENASIKSNSGSTSKLSARRKRAARNDEFADIGISFGKFVDITHRHLLANETRDIAAHEVQVAQAQFMERIGNAITISNSDQREAKLKSAVIEIMELSGFTESEKMDASEVLARDSAKFDMFRVLSTNMKRNFVARLLNKNR